jgi:outer membrane cobalamin receptor
MKLVKSLCIAIIILLQIPLFSQIKLQTIDNTDNNPIIGAYVKVDSIENITDDNGFVSMNLPIGKHSVLVKMIGYDVFFQKVNFSDNSFTINLIPFQSILNTVTVTSGKYDKALGEVTVSLDILKANMIENVNTKTADKVLDKIPGVQVIDGQANIRGGSGFSYGAGSRVAILIDDIPALQVDGGSANWRDIPVENMEQIEVLKGAASSLYGSAAMNGIINFRTGYAISEPITKIAIHGTGYLSPKDDEKKWWSTLPYEAGFTILHKQKFNKLDFVGSAFYLNTDTYNQKTFDKYGRTTVNLRYRMTDNFNFGVNFNYNKGVGGYFFYWKNSTNGAFLGDSSSVSVSNKERYMIDPFINYTDKFNNKHKLNTRFYSISNGLNANRANKSFASYFEYQIQHRFKNNFILTGGLVKVNSSVDAQLYGNSLFKVGNSAAYIQVDKKLWDKLSLSIGARYENNIINSPDSVLLNGILKKIWLKIPEGKSSESKPVFRIGANYQVQKATFLRASWGQAYRFPTVAEKFISTNLRIPIIPNPDLTSETGWSAELGIKQGFKINEFVGYLDASIFQSEYENMMEFVINNEYVAFQSQNIGNTTIKGFELSMGGQGNVGNSKITTLIGFTHINPKFKEFTEKDSLASTSKENVLKYRFRDMFKADIQLDYRKLSFGISLQSNSKMEAIDAAFDYLIPGLPDYRAKNNNGFSLLDVRTAYNWTSKIKTSFILSNLLNTEYSLRPGLLEAPKNITLRLDYKF